MRGEKTYCTMSFTDSKRDLMYASVTYQRIIEFT